MPCVVGTLRITSAGFGLVRGQGEEIFMGPRALGIALDGDAVEVEITGRGEKGPRGQVRRVLARPPRRIIGIVDDAGAFVPDDARFGRALHCTGPIPQLMQGLVLCAGELLPDLRPETPEVLISRHFGRRGDPRAEEDAILWREGAPEDFSPAALEEAAQRARSVYAEPDPSRVDLRALGFISVDPATAEDHDDAVFAKRGPNGEIHVFVAIADVAAFLPEGGALDREARRRGTSLYLTGRVVPMLPPVLSNLAASLLPGVDRVAIVLELILDGEPRVRERKFSLGMIRSRAKLTYEEASEVLRSRGADGSPAARAHAGALLLVDELAQRLRAQRRERGAVAFEARELKLETDVLTGMPLSLRRATEDPWLDRAHQLIEELMLLANETIASMLQDNDGTFLSRSHEAPSAQRALRLVQRARDAGINIPEASVSDALSLRQFIARSEEATQKQLTALLLEELPAASYAPQQKEHFALASSHYVHFTSPIRRYADVTVHRAIRGVLTGKPISAGAGDADDANGGQLRARAIQREIADLNAALLMQAHIGELHAGTLLRVMARQCIVAIAEPCVCVRCKRPNHDLTEGAEVTVRIDNVSLANRTIEGSFVSGKPGGFAPVKEPAQR